MKQAVHDGQRHWPNVGHTCTRCRHEINPGEKSERFRAKGGSLRVRHLGDCPQSRSPHSVVSGDLDALFARRGRIVMRVRDADGVVRDAIAPYSREARYGERYVRNMREEIRDWGSTTTREEDLRLYEHHFRRAMEDLINECQRYGVATD